MSTTVGWVKKLSDRLAGAVQRFRQLNYQGPLLYTISSVVKTATKVVTAFLVASLVLPEDMGTWQSIAVLQSYFLFFSLGIHIANGRQVAINIGAAEQEKATHYAQVTFTYVTLWSVINMLIVVGLGLYNWSQGADDKLLTAYMLFTLNTGSQPFVIALHNLFRNGDEFGQLGRIQLIEASLMVVSVFLVLGFGWQGFFLRNSVLAFLSAAMRFYWSPLPLGFRFDWPLFKELFWLGVPRLVNAYIYSLFAVADRTLIIANLGREALGFYALALMIQDGVGVFPRSINQIVGTRMNMRFGRQKTAHSLQRMIVWVLLANAVLLLVPIGLGILLIRPFIELFLPAYAPGITSAQIMLIVAYFVSLRAGGLALATLNRMRPLILGYLGGLGLLYVLGWIGLQYSASIETIAIVKLITIVLVTLYLNVVAYSMTKDAGNFDTKGVVSDA